MKLNSLESVYQYYVKDVYRYLYSLSSDHHAAEDLVQETFYRAYLFLENGRMNESSHGYFGSPITLMSIISARPAAKIVKDAVFRSADRPPYPGEHPAPARSPKRNWANVNRYSGSATSGASGGFSSIHIPGGGGYYGYHLIPYQDYVISGQAAGNETKGWVVMSEEFKQRLKDYADGKLTDEEKSKLSGKWRSWRNTRLT